MLGWSAGVAWRGVARIIVGAYETDTLRRKYHWMELPSAYLTIKPDSG